MNTNPNHTFNLCAPKAIGPELREAIIEVNQKSKRQTGANAVVPSHSLKAAFFCQTEAARKLVFEYATQGMNFAPENLIPATFDQETVGDLISEQLLLCGGVFIIRVDHARNANCGSS